MSTAKVSAVPYRKFDSQEYVILMPSDWRLITDGPDEQTF